MSPSWYAPDRSNRAFRQMPSGRFGGVKAWSVQKPGPIGSRPLRCAERAVPDPGPGQILIQVSVCGVCRTDLHLAEGDLTPRRPGVTPGHEIVGIVDALGPDATRWRPGDRV